MGVMGGGRWGLVGGWEGGGGGEGRFTICVVRDEVVLAGGRSFFFHSIMGVSPSNVWSVLRCPGRLARLTLTLTLTLNVPQPVEDPTERPGFNP